MIRVAAHTIHAFGTHTVHVHAGTIAFLSKCVSTESKEVRNVFVTQCGRRATAEQASGIAYCIPPLYNIDGYDKIKSHIQYYQALGIDKTYVYHTNCDTIPLELDNTTNICMPWVSDIKIHQRGQVWQVNDCIQRAALDGFGWTLHVDIDEYLHLPSQTLLSHYTSLHNRSDAISFGSLRKNRITCHRWNSNRTYPNQLCPGANGWRKNLVKTSTVKVAQTHDVQYCYDKTCETSIINAKNAVIHHTRPGGIPGIQFHKSLPKG